ncbi:MAG: MBL fold metallo-hydrolase [Myxococcaceae bacterium]|nr:MBL fold metallo-hydrolase [Myxococcaceae bacterium]
MIAVDEAFLPGVGIHKIPTPVPFMEAGGPANAYALEDVGGGFSLFDCGCGTDEGLAALREGLASRGLEVKHLNRVIVSHGHVDHYGNAQTLAEESGCEVFVHPHDLEKIVGEGRWYRQLEKSWGYFLRLGVPEATLNAMLDGAKRSRPYARPVDRARVKTLAGGDALQFKYFDAKVLHLPGHTPGLVCLHVEKRKLLFADDHVLAKVSPNPLLDLSLGETDDTKFKALVSYYRSARAVKAMELECLLPGHGEAFKGHVELLEGLFQFYELRQNRIMKRLGSEPATVYELVSAVFPRVDIGRMYLMLSEVMGNVEVLEERGELERFEEGGRLKLRAARRRV